MNVSKKRAPIPHIGHAQFLILKSFGAKKTRTFAELHANRDLPDLTPSALCLALKRLASSGLISRQKRGTYEIHQAGKKAVRSIEKFYKPHVV